LFETQNWSCLEVFANQWDGLGGVGMECRFWGGKGGFGDEMGWYWVLGAGYWVLGSGFWVLGTGYWALGVTESLDIGHCPSLRSG
jgi:hypothetical protein